MTKIMTAKTMIGQTRNAGVAAVMSMMLMTVEVLHRMVPMKKIMKTSTIMDGKDFGIDEDGVKIERINGDVAVAKIPVYLDRVHHRHLDRMKKMTILFSR